MLLDSLAYKVKEALSSFVKITELSCCQVKRQSHYVIVALKSTERLYNLYSRRGEALSTMCSKILGNYHERAVLRHHQRIISSWLDIWSILSARIEIIGLKYQTHKA